MPNNYVYIAFILSNEHDDKMKEVFFWKINLVNNIDDVRSLKSISVLQINFIVVDIRQVRTFVNYLFSYRWKIIKNGSFN